MPLYDIKCTDETCGHIFEDIIKLDATEKPIVCPKCGKPAKILTTAVVPPMVSWKVWRL